MPRQSRVVIPQIPHHITQRGNYQLPVFEKADDYKRYCNWYNEYAARYAVKTYAYCLMVNHVHFIAEPEDGEGLARLFNTLHMLYAQNMNKRRNVVGHLWQGRFFSCALEERHLYRAIRYVENNPVRAHMVNHAQEYEWSSAQEHLGKNNGLIKLHVLEDLTGVDWQDYLQENDEKTNEEMRIITRKGLILGTDNFINEMEQRFQRRLTRLKKGRPRKSHGEYAYKK
jgi:putative transposase